MANIKRNKTQSIEKSSLNNSQVPPQKPHVYPPYPAPSGTNNLLVILLIVISFFAGYLFFKTKSLEKVQTPGATTQTAQANQQAQQAPPVPTITAAQVKKIFSGNNYIHFGDANKKVLFVEVSDPSCPFCHIAGGHNPELAKQVGSQFQYNTDGGSYIPPVPEMKKLVDDGKASFAMVYAPGHGNGELGMQALYCAQDQGKFWEVHDLLMSNAGYTLLNDKVKNDKANIPTLVDFLQNAIDSSFLTDCLTTGKYASRLKTDLDTATTLGYQGTPHFLVNTNVYQGAQSYSAMQQVVDAALK